MTPTRGSPRVRRPPATSCQPSGLIAFRPCPDVSRLWERGVGCYARRMDEPEWSHLGDDELVERRISQLNLKLEGTRLESLIQQLYQELTAKGLVFHPPCHVGD